MMLHFLVILMLKQFYVIEL